MPFRWIAPVPFLSGRVEKKNRAEKSCYRECAPASFARRWKAGGEKFPMAEIHKSCGGFA